MKILKSLTILSLLMTASCGLTNSDRPSVISLIQQSQSDSSELSLKEKAAIKKAIRSTYPPFPIPQQEALETIRKVNNPALNLWVQQLTALCRAIDDACADKED